MVVEVDLAPGLPGVQLVGLPDKAIQESRERVRSALRNSGFRGPLVRVVINPAPADLRKEGPCHPGGRHQSLPLRLAWRPRPWLSLQHQPAPALLAAALRPALGSARSATATGTALRQGGGSDAEAAQPPRKLQRPGAPPHKLNKPGSGCRGTIPVEPAMGGYRRQRCGRAEPSRRRRSNSGNS